MKDSATLASVRARVQSGETALSPAHRQDVVKALELLSDLSNTELDAIPAERRRVRKLIQANGYWQNSFTNRAAYDTWVECVIDAIRYCPIGSKPCHFGMAANLSPAWKAIDGPIAAAVDRGEESVWALTCVRHIFKFADGLDISPADFDNAAFQLLLQQHEEIEREARDNGGKRRPVTFGVDAGRAWNRFVHLRNDRPWLASFPPTLLSWKGQKFKRNIQVEEMSRPLQAEIARYLSWMKQGKCSDTGRYLDILDDSAPLPAKPKQDSRPFSRSTISQSLSAIRLSVTAAVELGGQSLDSIVSLRQIVGMTALACAMDLLEGRLQRNGRTLDTATPIAMARRLVALGRYLALSAETILKMRDFMRKELNATIHDEGRISDGRRKMVRQFGEPSKMVSWFDGPGKLFDAAEALRKIGIITPSSVSDVEIALASKLVQCAALTRADLVCLRHKGTAPTFILQHEASGTIMIVTVRDRTFPVPLDAESANMLGAYLAYYRPAWITLHNARDSDFLLPGKSSTGSRSAAGFATIFRNRWRELGLDVTPHACRHLAAKNMLAGGRNHPATVAALLGVGEDVIRRSFVAPDTEPAFETYQTALLEATPKEERNFLHNLAAKYRRSEEGKQK